MGLFDWLSEGLGSLGSAGADMGGAPPNSGAPGQPPQVQPPMPPVQPIGVDAPPPAPPPAAPPVDPSTTDVGGGMQGAGPGAPPVPMPQPRPDGAPGLPPPAPPPAAARPPITMNEPPPNAGPPMQLGPGLGVGAPPPAPSSGGVSWLPNQQGGSGLLQAIGASPDQANRLRAGIGAGLTAAGNSAGKSPFQALASGAGATMEGGSKEHHQNTKDAQAYLAQAIAAKKAGDDASYKTNYMQYLQADLKANQDKAASKDAASKNDSPTQLYLSANRLVQGDGDVKAASKSLMDARKSGTPQEAEAAQTKLQAIIQQKQQEHYAALGLHPQTAAQLAQQPGMTQSNPIDAGTAGITTANIAKKLQPGQYYKNPTDGKVYLYKGPSGGDSKATKPKPADPMNPSQGTMPKTTSAADALASAGSDD